MTSHPYRILLGASLALLVGAAGAQNAPDSSSRMPAQKGTITTMPAQPSEQPTDKTAADPNATSQGTAAPKADTTQSAPMRHAHKSAPRPEAVSPEEKSYRQALRQCVQERDESQRDTCIDNAIGQHPPNG
ncbi:MAG: hypothetical protein ABI541_09590 [Betaproteobacteria bacterium]